LLRYSHPRTISDQQRPEIVDQIYRLGPRTEYADQAWTAYARFLEASGKPQEAEEWYRRAQDARSKSLHPGIDTWLTLSSLLVVAVFLAAVTYAAVLYFRYLPQRKARSRLEMESGFRFRLLGLEYWRRAERISLFTIAAIGWLAVGGFGLMLSVEFRTASIPVSLMMGSFGGPAAIFHFESEVPPTPERDLLLAIAYHHDGQHDKAAALYRRLDAYPESWNKPRRRRNQR
jgi:tetratricopeptide (TPR) repeat protein